MGVEPVVLGPARFEVGNELGAAGPISPLQVVGSEGTQQQFGLIEPGGMRRGEEHPDMRVVVPQEIERLSADMAGAVVPDEVDAW